MSAVQEQEYRLIKGGSAPASTISRVLSSLQEIAQTRPDGQELLRTLSAAATPENISKPLKLNPTQLSYLKDLELTDSSDTLKNQKIAMVVCSCIHFCEGAYAVFAPNA